MVFQEYSSIHTRITPCKPNNVKQSSVVQHDDVIKQYGLLLDINLGGTYKLYTIHDPCVIQIQGVSRL